MIKQEVITRNRNHVFDLTRSLCVLWIVGFYHMLNYFPQNYHLVGKWEIVGYDITVCVLSCFTFLSGFFLKKYSFNNWYDVVYFYKKRLLRFWPLFVIASFTMLFWGCSIKAVLIAISGLSLVVPPAIVTIWYFSMLMLFYLLTPILKSKSNNSSFGRSLNYSRNLNNNKSYIIVLIISLFLLGISFFYADNRLILYLPFYVIGLNLSDVFVNKAISKRYLIFYLLAFLICEFLRQYIYPSRASYLFLPFEAVSGVFFILSFSKLIYSERYERFVTIISVASMCAYLFHRQLYTAILNVTNQQFMSIPLALISIIVLFVISYWIQRGYDGLLSSLKIK